MDWADTRYTREVRVNVVHQTNVDYTLGALSGVQLSNMTITENYNSDSRVQAKVTTIVPVGSSDDYIKNARLRIVLVIPERLWSDELVTGYVSDISEVKDHGYIKRTYSIEGTIWGLLDHKLADPVTISVGAKALDVWTSMLKKETYMQYSIEGARDHVFANTIIYEAGSTALSTLLFEIMESYNRMDANGHGVITLTPYVAPSQQTPGRTIYEKDLRNLLMQPLSKDSAEWEAPGRAIVTATISTTDEKGNSNQEVLTGKYDPPATDPTSIAVRGWLKARVDSYSGASETPSKSELEAIAKKNWENDQSKGIEWSAETVFGNYHAGEVCSLVFEDLTKVKVLLKSVVTHLDDMTQELTMKEV